MHDLVRNEMCIWPIGADTVSLFFVDKECQKKEGKFFMLCWLLLGPIPDLFSAVTRFFAFMQQVVVTGVL